MDPQSHGDAALVIRERRAALRIVDAVAFVPDLYVRDLVDDTGARGAVAWGARASDIIVVASAEADPAATFTIFRTRAKPTSFTARRPGRRRMS